MPSTAQTAAYVGGLLVFGSLNTISMKVMFTMKGVGATGEPELFQKPWFMTFVMFVSMALALIWDRDMRRRCCGKQSSLEASLIEVDTKLTWRKKVFMVIPAAAFDILATGLCSMGFLYIPASVWQLLRGAEMVFAQIFGVMFLGQESFCFNWLGVLLCSLGIVLVGLASVWGSASEEGGGGGGDVGPMLFGIGLALGGQVVQAAQVTAEEHLLKECDLPELQVVGFEGVWGGLIMVPMLIAFYYIPGSDLGRFEDVPDALDMVASSPGLAALMVVNIFSCCTYNMAGIAVTGALTAVHRVMIEALRTLVVWAFGLAVHASNPLSPFGEAWTPYSPLEVAGFCLIILGQGVYGAMVRMPGLSYPSDLEVMPVASPGNVRNLSAAIHMRSPSSRSARSFGAEKSIGFSIDAGKA